MVDPTMSQPPDPPAEIAAPMVRVSAPACTSDAEWTPPRNWAYERQGPWVFAGEVPRQPAVQAALPTQAAPVGDDTPPVPLEGDETPPVLLEGDVTPPLPLYGTPPVPLEGDATPPLPPPPRPTAVKSAPAARQRSGVTRAEKRAEVVEDQEVVETRGRRSDNHHRADRAGNPAVQARRVEWDRLRSGHVDDSEL